jgi:DnaK suppressor protein
MDMAAHPAHDGPNRSPNRYAMNTQQLQNFKRQLTAMRTDMLAQLAQLRGGEVGRAQASAAHFGGSEDNRAQRITDLDLEFALDAHESAALGQIDAALERLEAGTYGDCRDCGSAIAMARLQAAPQAMRCVGCQEAFERDSVAPRA